ncbi:Sterol regulatory element-binding protein 2 [Choanephora cucurbitarum]|uniref:Sterol regulatory element-binding protein 2 n=1 Tax=Choanephora cucurbitarum TaxID=101091 RepID=A0A1C7N1N9_9FUNG|nr:Sterol regulatory element-binding protein 2 [Choanephora cucurbitarum]
MILWINTWTLSILILMKRDLEINQSEPHVQEHGFTYWKYSSALNHAIPCFGMTAATKRKLSLTEESSPKKQQTKETPALPPPSMVALPPPLMQYPNGQIVSVVQQPPYYMYHPQQPIYYPVSPQQHPFIHPHASPVLQPDPSKKPSTPRILPKNPEMQSPYPQPPQTPLSPFYPYPFQQISPTLMPSSFSTRHNSISSSPGLGPSMLSTADEREKARKVSHSAIERRRRERINDKILQLKQLIPSCVEQDNLHKMSILQSAIDYITYLKDVVKKLDEGHGSDQLLKGDHLKVKATKSMLPKEVEPFTTQFSIQKISTEEEGSTEIQRGLKPMDIIRSGTPLVPVQQTPLTPPQESQSANTSHSKLAETSHEETRHMRLENILC